MSIIQYPLIVGPFPPPVQGNAVVTALVAKLIEGRGVAIERCNVSGASTGKRTLHHHVVRALRYFKVYVTLVGADRRRPVYVCSSGRSGQLYECLMFLICRAKRMRPVVHHHNFNYLTRYSWLARLSINLAGPRAIHVVLCERMARLLCDKYGAGTKTVVLSNASLLGTKSTCLDLGAAPKRRVGFLANLTLEKGTDLVIRVARILANHDIETVIAGPIVEDEVNDLLRSEVETNDRLKYVGPLYGEAKLEFFRSIDVFLLLSRNEAEPIVLHEAAAAAVPVVATDVGCVREMIGTAGIVVESEEPVVDDVATIVVSIIDNRKAYDALRAAAKRRFETRKRDGAIARERFLTVLLSEEA